ncbi:MAG: aminopeptidase P family protein [Alphaproteobacteria bacterium]|nr:aminopeptidase P family protein [Alphaproteobacteria bacterium]
MLADRRRRRLTDAMAEAGLDALVIYGNAWQGDYLRYATDFGILEGQALAIVRRDGHITLYLDSPLEADRAALDCPGLEIVQAPDFAVEAERAMERMRNQRIGAAPWRLIPRRIGARADDLKLGDETAFFDRLLMHKIDDEIAAIRRASRLADEGYKVFMQAARVGRADYELVAEAEAFFRAKGVPDNFQIVGVGGVEVKGMAPPSGRRLKRGDMVTTELTPCIDGYYAQICRTLVIGDATPEQKAAHALWRESMEAGIATVRDGVTAADIAKAENDVFRKHGMGQYTTSEYTRVRGHGMGLFADSKPHILEDVTTRIEAGMALIVHPNTYHPAVGYMVLGDGVAVTEDGCEVLTATPRELFGVAG